MSRPLPMHWFLFGLACAAALPAAYTLDPMLDVDTWWHMAVGRWMVQNRDVPWIDPFSQMSRDNPVRWYAYSWVYDLWVYGIYDKFGCGGILLFRTLLTMASTMVMFAYLARRGGQTLATVLLAILTGSILMMFAKERPWHFSFVGATLTVWAVHDLRDGGKVTRTLWLIPVYALWANYHIQFVYGWFILVSACAFPGQARRISMIAIAVACILATFINPYHVRLIAVIVEYAQHAAPAEYINELAPPEWHAPSTIATALLVLIGFANIGRRRPIDGFALLFLIVATVMACRMRRDIWFAALAAIGTLHANMNSKIQPRRLLHGAMTTALIFALIRALACAQQQYWGDLNIKNAYFDSHGTPLWNPKRSQIIYAADTNNMSDTVRHSRFYNHFNDGGWLIWHFPKNGVSIDGRTNLYGDDRIRRSFQTWNCEGDWQNDPDLRNANIVFAPPGLPLTLWLSQSADWKLITKNANAVVFERVLH